MNRISPFFLKIVLVIIALITLTWLLWFPQTEGRAVHLDIFEIYSDPFILYGYIAAIPFFMALYQAFMLLTFIEKNKSFTHHAVKAVRTIQTCAFSTAGFLLLAILFIRFFAHGDDPAGPTMIGFIGIVTSLVIAAGAGMFQKLLVKGEVLQSEHDLTV